MDDITALLTNLKIDMEPQVHTEGDRESSHDNFRECEGEVTSVDPAKKKQKRKRHDVTNRYYKTTRECDRQRWSMFTFPVPESVIVLRVDNVHDGQLVRKRGRLSRTILGIVDEIMYVAPDHIRIKGKYIDPENEKLKDKTIIRVDDLPFKDYGYYNFWYVRNIPARFTAESNTASTSSASDTVQVRFMNDVSDASRPCVHMTDGHADPVSSRKKNKH